MTTDPTPSTTPSPPIDPVSDASARAVMPRVIGLTGARSVVDVGCGTGAWSRACRELGVPEVVGVDGAYVPAEHRVHPTAFIERDLAEPLDLGRSFGLAICVDVAEDLPPERAPGLVADLTGLAPVVLFAAAVPGQTRHRARQRAVVRVLGGAVRRRGLDLPRRHPALGADERGRGLAAPPEPVPRRGPVRRAGLHVVPAPGRGPTGAPGRVPRAAGGRRDDPAPAAGPGTRGRVPRPSRNR